MVLASSTIGSGRTPGKDRKSTRLNSSHLVISYAVFCLKKKTIRAANWYAGQLTSGDTRLVCSGAAIRLVEKLTYREIYKFRSFLQGSVASRRHNDKLPIRQAPEYLDRFLYRREIVIASHDENRCRDLFEVGGVDRDGGYPHGVALSQHRHPMSGTVGAGPPVVRPEVWRQRVRYCLKLVG